MKAKTKAYISKALTFTKAIAVAAWTVPAVKSALLTWVVRIGIPSALATAIFAIADALNGNI